MLEQYLPVVFQTLIAIGFAAIALGLSVLLGKKGRTGGAKDTVYERHELGARQSTRL